MTADSPASAPEQQASARSLGALIWDGGSRLVEFVARIVRKLTGVAPIALAIGCESAQPPAPPPPPAPAVEVPVPAKVEGPRSLGEFTITFYYMIGEDEVAPKRPSRAAANDNELAAVAPPDPVTLFE